MPLLKFFQAGSQNGCCFISECALLTLLSNFCQVTMVLHVFLQKIILSVCKNFTGKMTWNQDFLQEKPLKNKTMAYTSGFTASVLKASSKFEKVREDSFIDFGRRNNSLTPTPLLKKREPRK